MIKKIALGLLAVLVVVLLLVATFADTGDGPTVHSSTPLPALHLASYTLTWSLDEGPGTEALLEDGHTANNHVTHVVSDILNDKKGWKRSGIFFKYVKTPNANTSIVFHVMDNPAGCNGTKTADANVAKLGCTDATDPQQCKVYFPFYTFFNDKPLLQRATVNQEVGQCFGFPRSTTGGLTKPSLPTKVPVSSTYPSAAMIKHLKALVPARKS